MTISPIAFALCLFAAYCVGVIAAVWAAHERTKS